MRFRCDDSRQKTWRAAEQRARQQRLSDVLLLVKIGKLCSSSIEEGLDAFPLVGNGLARSGVEENAAVHGAVEHVRRKRVATSFRARQKTVAFQEPILGPSRLLNRIECTQCVNREGRFLQERVGTRLAGARLMPTDGLKAFETEVVAGARVAAGPSGCTRVLPPLPARVVVFQAGAHLLRWHVKPHHLFRVGIQNLVCVLGKCLNVLGAL